jgi:putative DNA primase/helicase
MTASEEAQLDDTIEITRLAALSPLQCDRELPAAAEKLACRVPTLRAQVEAMRRKVADADNTGGQGRRIVIPDFEPWPEPVDGAAVLDELAREIRNYVILSPIQVDAATLWVIFTHSFGAFDFSPKLVIRSVAKRSGKTRLIEVLARVVHRAFFASGITAAALLRMIEQHSPAMLLDEIDAQMKGDAEMAEVLRGMINSGFTRAGARFVKNVPTPDGGFEPNAFSTWCPMLLAGIGNLPDTIADRAITIEMTRKLPEQTVRRLRARDGGELRDLGRKFARWTVDNFAILQNADPEAPQQLNDRSADAWSPLLAIADTIGGEWPRRARIAAIGLSDDDDGQTIAEMLLKDICEAFGARKADRLASEDLVAHLIQLEDRPWSEINRGRALTKTGLAQRLRPFRILPSSIRLDDGRTPKGYYRSAFDEVFARYLSSPLVQNATLPQARKSTAFTANATTIDANDVAFQMGQNPAVSAGCGVVAVRKPLWWRDDDGGRPDRDPEEVEWTE